jgi:A/G-specific adenine glycosylase
VSEPTVDLDSELVAAVGEWARRSTAEREMLPWRRTTDPWVVLLSEVMLAQTQVARVAERFDEMVRRFPTPGTCAEAPVGEVVRAWSGLGYNRRAVALHRTAVAIVTEHSGKVPRDLDALVALPGIGPYTARAILAFAFEETVGVVDVNIRRVLLRARSGSALSDRETQRLADRLVAGTAPRTWNLALMDFGSLVCRARAPRCGECPIAHRCRWRVAGGPDPAARGRSQARFSGSDREGRGRLLRAACAGPIDSADVPRVAGWPDDPARAERVSRALVAEGLLRRVEDQLRLS